MAHLSRPGVRGAAWLTLGLMLLCPSRGRADALAGYSVQVLAQVGQTTGDFTPHNAIDLGQLNDQGQLALGTADSKGGQLLGQWSAGKFTQIAAAGGPAPGGKTWPNDM